MVKMDIVIVFVVGLLIGANIGLLMGGIALRSKDKEDKDGNS